MRNDKDKSYRVLLAVLLIASAALFAVGTAIERHDINKEKSKQRTAAGTHGASSEGSTSESGGETGGESAAHHAAEKGNEKVFGINTESIPLVIAAVLVSILLAIGVLRRPDSAILLLIVVLLGIASAVFDVREAVHQANESRTTVETIAIVVAALHIGVAGLAAFLLRRATSGPASI